MITPPLSDPGMLRDEAAKGCMIFVIIAYEHIAKDASDSTYVVLQASLFICL